MASVNVHSGTDYQESNMKREGVSDCVIQQIRKATFVNTLKSKSGLLLVVYATTVCYVSIH